MENRTADYVRAVFDAVALTFPKVWGQCKYSTRYYGTNTKYLLFSSCVDAHVTHGKSHFAGYIYHEVSFDHIVRDESSTLMYRISSIYEDTGENSSVTYPVSVDAVSVDMGRPASEIAEQIKSEVLASLHANAAMVEDVPTTSFVHACFWHAKRLYSVSPEPTGG